MTFEHANEVAEYMVRNEDWYDMFYHINDHIEVEASICHECVHFTKCWIISAISGKIMRCEWSEANPSEERI